MKKPKKPSNGMINILEKAPVCGEHLMPKSGEIDRKNLVLIWGTSGFFSKSQEWIAAQIE